MKLVTFNSQPDLLDAFYTRLVSELSSPPVSGRPAGIMLSGGSTPLPIFNRLADDRADVAPNIHILYTDDRLVAPDSGDSNYGNSLKMLKALAIPPERVIHLDSRLDLEAAATAYDAAIKQFLMANGVVTLGVLGLGADGHTCSIFSAADARRDDQLAFAVPGRLGFDRVTVSRLVLAHTERIVFLAAGESKREKIQTLLDNPLSIPAGIAVDGHPNVEVWTDVSL